MPENSMRIIHSALEQRISEGRAVLFLDDAIQKNFRQRKDNEEYPENTVFILENLNFKPDEFGYVEPEKQPVEEGPTEEELKKEEEAKQAAAKKPPAKMSAADKKKAEEEAKKKAEEEAKRKAEEATSKANAFSEEEQAEIQRQKDEAERIKRELEHFDYKTIHQYKQNLGLYGDFYINDAIQATLTNSNSVAEVIC